MSNKKNNPKRLFELAVQVLAFFNEVASSQIRPLICRLFKIDCKGTTK